MTASAIVPLLLISTKVMMAISSSGTSLPNMVSEKTSLGFGHGTVVEVRTIMYEIRKLPKMKVSLTRKIHIIGLPQGTPLKARWSEEKSATMPCIPWDGSRWAAGLASCDMAFGLLSKRGVRSASQRDGGRADCEPQEIRRQHGKQHDPDQQQEVPVDGAQFDAHPDPREVRAALGTGR